MQKKEDLNWSLFENDTAELKADNLSDALTVSRRERGRIDIDLIADLLKKTPDEVQEELAKSNLAYRDPVSYDGEDTARWLYPDEYLSGNMAEKFKEAKAAKRKWGKIFNANIAAIREALPAEIYTTPDISLGTPWIPTAVIDQFLHDMLKIGTMQGGRVVLPRQTMHDPISGKWQIVGISDLAQRSAEASYKYGTDRINSLRVISKTLNGEHIAIYDTEEYTDDKGKRRTRAVLNEADTVEALKKQEQLIKDFRSWIWRDKRRADELTRIYQDEYLSVVPRQYDGSYLTFPHMNPSIQLQPHQRNAVARIIQTDQGVILNHSVGAGKTYVQIAAGLEALRIGLIKKPLYVVPNQILAQWVEAFSKLYPGVNLFVVTPSSMTPARREQTLKAVRDGSYDAVLMPKSCFTSIPLSKDVLIQQIKRRLSDLIAASKQDDAFDVSPIETLKKRLEDVRTREEKKGIKFEELGFDQLFVDESQLFKDRSLAATTGWFGSSVRRSTRSRDLEDKIQWMQHEHGNNRVVFATGTPLTNSLTELYGIQKLLQPAQMDIQKLGTLNSWLKMFTDEQAEIEVGVTGNTFKIGYHLSKYHNLKALSLLLSGIFDTYTIDDKEGLPECGGYETVAVPEYPGFVAYMAELADRIEAIRHRKPLKDKDNMLAVTVDARKAAIDLRTIDDTKPADPASKLHACADKVAEIYHVTTADRLTQAVFCDIGIPGKEFSVYEELKTQLIGKGVNPCEIAFIHDADSATAKEKLFEQVREGEIRVIIGSTALLGTGVNVQTRLVAAHMLDVPWTPAQMEQRCGRILRQGNMNKEVHIFRYIQQGSFDAYSYQLLQRKQAFIDGLLTNTLKKTYAEGDIGDMVLSYSEAKAQALSNPAIKERVELENKIWQNEKLKEKNAGEIARLTKLQEIEKEKLAELEDMRSTALADAELINSGVPKATPAEKQEFSHQVHEAMRDIFANQIDRFSYRGFTAEAGWSTGKVITLMTGNGEYDIPCTMLDDPARKVDYFIDHFGKHIDRVSKQMDETQKKIKGYGDMIDKATKQNFDQEINKLKKKLAVIDSSIMNVEGETDDGDN